MVQGRCEEGAGEAVLIECTVWHECGLWRGIGRADSAGVNTALALRLGRSRAMDLRLGSKALALGLGQAGSPGHTHPLQTLR